MQEYGCQSMVAPIRSLLLKHPREAFLSPAKIQAQWQDLNYLAPPDLDRAIAEYEVFVSLLEQFIPEIHFLPADEQTTLDSIYTHDPVLMTRRGAILCNMGKPQRQPEVQAIENFLLNQGMPILGRISGTGRLEGGDVVWIDEHTLAVGRGYRTNDEGIRQLQHLTADFVQECVVVPLPHWNGPQDVLHLMSLLSPVDEHLAVVYSRLLPVPFREWLLSRDIRLVEVPDQEYDSMACNVLALAPKKCVMIAGNPITRARLEKEGVDVWEFPGEEICKKGAGGPTCLTRPLLRTSKA
ncbi:MAG: amidinotransferase [Calditrichaeota bacterium]|nr:MAG: amidinotransferase [Calditrichota bacterium]